MSIAQLTPPVLPRDHTLGRPEAGVTLVEFADFQCPSCRRAHGILKDVRAALGDDLRFVYRHFPVTERHPNALNAALAAEAAGAQGQFWQMSDLLFGHQDALDANALRGYAETLGLDVAQFDRDLKSGRFVERVREDYESGERSDLEATPAFYVNGVRYDGQWRDREVFVHALRRALPPRQGASGVTP